MFDDYIYERERDFRSKSQKFVLSHSVTKWIMSCSGAISLGQSERCPRIATTTRCFRSRCPVEANRRSLKALAQERASFPGQRFANVASVSILSHKRLYSHTASKSSGGRSFFLAPRPANFLKPNDSIEYPLAKLVTFTEHKDTIRRGGVANTIK